MWLWIFLAVLSLVAVYVFVLRDKLRAMPAFAPFYAWIEPIEAKLWAKSRTLFLARLVWVPGALLTIHDFLMPALGLIDWNPMSASFLLSIGIPAQFHAATMVAATTALARVFEWLRKVTGQPLDEKE